MKRQHKANLMKVDLDSHNKQQTLKCFLVHMMRATARLHSDPRGHHVVKDNGTVKKLVC